MSDIESVKLDSMELEVKALMMSELEHMPYEACIASLLTNTTEEDVAYAASIDK